MEIPSEIGPSAVQAKPVSIYSRSGPKATKPNCDINLPKLSFKV